MNASPSLRIAPSVLSADFSRLGEEIRTVETAGADLLHLDVMDGHFVPNLTFGPVVIKGIRKLTDLFLDTHLMITHPQDFMEEFAKAGSNGLTFHVELFDDCRPHLDRVRALGMRAGLSISPPTPFEKVEPWLDQVDLLLAMSVNPGFGGQSFMPEVLDKVRRAAAIKRERGLEFDIEIDGGIGMDTAAAATEAGAEILVAGSAVFGAPDPARAVNDIRAAGARGLAKP